jgi:hypothetical protein
MKSVLQKPIYVFLISMLLIALPLFLFPINLFQGVIVYQEGLVETTVEAPLSLSYFVGMGYNPDDLMGIKSFHLKPGGYVLATLLILGIPGLIAYRVNLRK